MRLPQDRILHIDTELKDGKVNIVAEWQGELVRCKDCRYRKKVGTSYYCELDEINVKDTDFCSWGERKEPLPQYAEWKDAFEKMTESAKVGDHDD